MIITNHQSVYYYLHSQLHGTDLHVSPNLTKHFHKSNNSLQYERHAVYKTPKDAGKGVHDGGIAPVLWKGSNGSTGSLT